MKTTTANTPMANMAVATKKASQAHHAVAAASSTGPMAGAGDRQSSPKTMPSVLLAAWLSSAVRVDNAAHREPGQQLTKINQRASWTNACGIRRATRRSPARSPGAAGVPSGRPSRRSTANQPQSNGERRNHARGHRPGPRQRRLDQERQDRDPACTECRCGAGCGSPTTTRALDANTMATAWRKSARYDVPFGALDGILTDEHHHEHAEQRRRRPVTQKLGR